MKYFFFIILFLLLHIPISYSQHISKKSSEKTEVKAVAIKMLKWYYYDTTIPMKDYIVNYLSQKKEDSSLKLKVASYTINTYFPYLKKANFFSPSFLKNILTYFKSIDTTLNIDYLNDINVYSKYQNYVLLKDGYDENIERNLKNVEIVDYTKVGNTAHISLQFAGYAVYTFELLNNKNKWLINKISIDIASNYVNAKSKLKKNAGEKEIVKATASAALEWFFYTYRNTRDTLKFGYIKGEEGDSTNPYRIDFNKANIFFEYLLKTNLFSKKFTNNLLIYFKKCDSNFVAVKQYYSVPLGFEYNLITKDTDDMEVEENIYKSKISSYKKNGNTVYMSLKFDNRRTYTFIITKYNGKWLLDNINGDFPPLYSTPI